MTSEVKQTLRVYSPILGFLILYYTAKTGIFWVIAVGLGVTLVLGWWGGGGRKPSSIPAKDALLYIGIAVALVLGIVWFGWRK